MAERKPVVLVDGQLKEMPTGDTVPAANIPEVTAPNIHAATSKTTPADADELGLSDSAASWGLKKLTFANLKTWIGSFFVSKSGDTMTGNLMVEGVGHADVAVRSYGYGGDGATMHGYQALGTKAVPTAPTAGDPIFGIGARPYTGAGWAAHSVGAIHIFARQNITATQQGTSFRIATTPLGGTWNERIHAVAFECDGVGQGPRWRAKFSGTLTERGYVQDSTGASTTFGIMSGASGASQAVVNLFSRSDPQNAPYLQMGVFEDLGFARIVSGKTGTGAAIPLRVGDGTSGAVLDFTTDGRILAGGGAVLGYGTGSGGTVQQLTSKSTAVSLNKASGQISMHNESLAAGASVAFTFTNSTLGGGDGVLVRPNGFAGYAVEVEYSASATSVVLRVTNRGATRSDALSIVFQIIKGSAS